MATSPETRKTKRKGNKVVRKITQKVTESKEIELTDRKGIYWEKIEPNLDLIGAWVRDGLTVKQIADNLGVSHFTLNKYQQRYPELKDVFKDNRQKLDYVHMINAYQMRAEGYTAIEREEEYKVLEDGTEVLVKVKKRERHVPADPRSLENWIQLRMKNDPLWGQLREIIHDNNIETSGEGGLVFIPAKKVLEVNGEGNSMETATPSDGVHEQT